jgi:predicted TIM-barrel fold metal-dependent hydrolase
MPKAHPRSPDQSLTSRFDVIDVDSHISEPPDLWTSRIASKWGELVPHVAWDERRKEERWYVGDQRLPGVGSFAIAGWHDYPPSHPPTLAEADPGAFDPHARVKRLDEFGIRTQLLYPNILGLYSHLFAAVMDKELSLLCVKAYNDFLAEFCATAPDRLVGLLMIPFWDIQASVAEIERAAGLGHRGVVMGADYSGAGLPQLGDEYWKPVLEAAQGNGLPINFHIGFQPIDSNKVRKHQKILDRTRFVKETVDFMMVNANQISEVILSGVCERYPKLAFVSVESGASWLPWLLEALDWQWMNSGAARDLPQRLLPSEYFRRQVYGSFWFEKDLLHKALELYPDNLMFESDFPHPTSLSPGPCSTSPGPSQVIDAHLAGLPEDVIEKVLHQNAARVYNL